ncbi:MAG: hypothetical protein K0U98_04080 [Deltaproteobacteria bacterium]|nr:hypothetical protein [Deltaproteobacteria bacterium]
MLIHKGNIHSHSNGCILLGSSLGFLGGMWAVLGSGKAFGFFSEQVEGEFWLTISNSEQLSKMGSCSPVRQESAA